MKIAVSGLNNVYNIYTIDISDLGKAYCIVAAVRRQRRQQQQTVSRKVPWARAVVEGATLLNGTGGPVLLPVVCEGSGTHTEQTPHSPRCHRIQGEKRHTDTEPHTFSNK